jgi:hypothetical protein
MTRGVDAAAPGRDRGNWYSGRRATFARSSIRTAATGDWWTRERIGLDVAPATLSYLSNDSTREARESRIR